MKFAVSHREAKKKEKVLNLACKQYAFLRVPVLNLIFSSHLFFKHFKND